VVSAAGENVGDLVVSGKEALNLPRRLEPLHELASALAVDELLARLHPLAGPAFGDPAGFHQILQSATRPLGFHISLASILAHFVTRLSLRSPKGRFSSKAEHLDDELI
jgi:hypothetical protein